MKFTVLTLFPDIVKAFFENSIMAKAVKREIIAYDLVNIRDFAFDKHHACDDGTYGGGAGQLMLAEPLANALDSVNARKKYVIYVTPSGKKFTQKIAEELSRKEELVFICGRYEGVDQRIIDFYADAELSIGDYVMSSGEVAAAVVIDTVYRLVDGVISRESLQEESFCDGLLEYPQYTHPEEWRGMKVPAVLLSGNHKEIQKWRMKKRLMKTMANRPDLIAGAMENDRLSLEAKNMIEEITETFFEKRLSKKRNLKNGKIGEENYGFD